METIYHGYQPTLPLIQFSDRIPMKPIRVWAAQEDAYVLDTLYHHESKHLLGLLSNNKLRIVQNVESNAFTDIALTSSALPTKQVLSFACAGCSLVNKESTLPQFANLVWTSSAEGVVSAFDLSSAGRPVANCLLPRTKISSVDIGLNGTLIACGTEEGFDSKIVFWDVRNTKNPLGMYQESHSDNVTQVRFSPNGTSALLSGSEDGLVCAFDVSKPNETAALKSVMNAGSAVSKLGFFGASFQGMYVTTTTETLSLFDVGSCERISAYDNDLMAGTGCRETLQTIAGVEINYLIDCLWEPKTQKLVLCAGNSQGVGFGFEMTLHGFLPLGPLPGGHTEVIRCARMIELGPEWGGFGILTGGEDGKMCLWTAE